jgi:hypothetical protein
VLKRRRKAGRAHRPSSRPGPTSHPPKHLS